MKRLISSRTWVILFIAISGLIIMAIGITNFLIDPLGEREWFVVKKYKPIFFDRSEKYKKFFKEDKLEYNTLILGSSRVMNITPKNNDGINKIYNFGVNHGNYNDYNFLINEITKRQENKIKHIIIGIDFSGTYLTKNKSGEYLSNQKYFENLLSYDTLKLSYKSFRNKLNNEPTNYFNDDGVIIYSKWEDERRKNIYKYPSVEDFPGNQFKKENINFAIPKLKSIKKKCDENGIKLTVIITPEIRYLYIGYMLDSEIKSEYINFRKYLVDIFGEVYDFGGNYEINNNPQNYYDLVHYVPEIGDIILSIILDKSQRGNYGKKINKDNIEKHTESLYNLEGYKKDELQKIQVKVDRRRKK